MKNDLPEKSKASAENNIAKPEKIVTNENRIAHSWDLCPETGEWKRQGSEESAFIKKGQRLPADHAPAIWKLNN